MTRSFMCGARLRVLAFAVGGLCLLGAGNALADPLIPFHAAAVQQDGSDQFVVRWTAPGVREVGIYALRGPDGAHPGRKLAEAGGDGSVDLTLAPRPRRYFELVPNVGQPLVVAPRSLHISAVNARDVGGYRTRDGAWVRMGVAYRTNALNTLDAADIAKLEALHIRTIVDLRTRYERRRWPDAIIPGAVVVDANVLADKQAQIRAWETQKKPLKLRDLKTMLAQIRDLYRDFVRLPSARAAYHTLFMHLAERSALPLMFHCTAGKDRTGWGQAVLLTILGVPHAVIVKDYSLSGYYLMQSPSRLAKILTAGVNPAVAKRMLGADPADLAVAFDEVDEDYGSFDNYLHHGLGLDDATLAAIRRNFLAQ